jgi:hypothetical protein
MDFDRRMGGRGGGDGLGFDDDELDDIGDELGGQPPPPPGLAYGAPPPAWGGGYGAGYGTAGAIQALDNLRRMLRQTSTGNPAALAALQQAFDSFRNALKQAFPTGGPHGPVG